MPTAKLTVPADPDAFEAALEGLVRVNEIMLGTGVLPPLYETGVRYQAERDEVWKPVTQVLTDGVGDCEDLASWRAAEMRVSGEDPGARVHTYQSGPRRFHAVVMGSDGHIEDPSRALGMRSGGPQLGIDACCVLGADPTPGFQNVSFEIHHIPAQPAGWGRPAVPAKFMGVARVPVAGGQALFTTSSPQTTAEAAAGKALDLAAQAAKNPTAAAAAALPPGAKAALDLINAIDPTLKNKVPPQALAAAMALADPGLQDALKTGDLKKVYEALPPNVKALIPSEAQAAAAILTNPTLEAFLKSDNPVIRAANLLNPMTLARPDIYVQNAIESAKDVGDLLKFW